MEKTNKKQVINLQVTEDLTVAVLPNSNHEFLMSTDNVAIGYGVSTGNIRNQLHRNQTEFQKGKHFDSAVCFSNSELKAVHNKVYWTKRGIVRLGFFIKSQRARLFRDWAEDLVIGTMNAAAAPIVAALPPKTRHNRLTPLRLVDIMADVCRIEDKELRLTITSKLLQS